MSTSDTADDRTLEDDRAELSGLGAGSPLDEGEGEATLPPDDLIDESPTTASPALLGGAPVPSATDPMQPADRLI
jgi:hypothetical protein